MLSVYYVILTSGCPSILLYIWAWFYRLCTLGSSVPQVKTPIEWRGGTPFVNDDTRNAIRPPPFLFHHKHSKVTRSDKGAGEWRFDRR